MLSPFNVAASACLLTAMLAVAPPAGAQVQPSQFPPIAYASSSEYSNCTVPKQVTFRLEDTNAPWYPPVWKTVRYVMFPGQTELTKMAPAPGGWTTGKNPEMDPNTGPRQAENCGPSGYTQYMQFRVKTTNYFSQPNGGTVAGNHVVFAMKSAATATTVDAIALVLHVNPISGMGPGFYPERIRIGVGPGDLPSIPPVRSKEPEKALFPAQDGITYFVEIFADPTGIVYHIVNESTGLQSDWIAYRPPYFGVGTGIGFASVCADNNGSCEQFNYQTQAPHKVEIWDITAN